MSKIKCHISVFCRALEADRSRAGKGAVLFMLAGLLVSLTASAVSAAFEGPKLCVPSAQGVPYLHGPPNWWTQSSDPEVNRLAFSYHKSFMRTDDPRWRGALAVGHSMGATDNAEFRALYSGNAPDRYLYLSWAVKSMEFNVGSTSIVFGLKTPTGDPIVVKLSINQSSTQNPQTGDVEPRPMVEGNPPNEITYVGYGGFTSSGGGAWGNLTFPPWLDHPRVWIMPAGTTGPGSKPAFTLQVRIPLGASGLNLSGNTFSMWYSMQPSIPTTPTPGLVFFTWPRDNQSTPEPDFGYWESIIGGKHIPDPSEWGEFALGSQAGCAGVTLSSGNVGVMNSQFQNSRAKISLQGPNTFYALPMNSTGQDIDMSGIKTTFYFANWGTQRGALTSESWKTLTPQLVQVPVVNPSPSAPIDPNVATDPTAVPQSKLVQNSTSVTFSQDEACRFFVEGQPDKYLAEEIFGQTYCDNYPEPPDLNPHGCVLVKMDSTTLEFLNDSVAKNMDFAKASLFERSASISVVGLPPHPSGSRDVFLMVDRRSMGTVGDEIKGQLKEIINVLKRGQVPKMSYESLATIMPTFAIHAFNDTGKKVYIDDVQHILLEQQTSFGYFGWHEGAVKEWITQLTGAEKIPGTTNFKLSVPNNGVSTIMTSMEAIQSSAGRRCFEWFGGR